VQNAVSLNSALMTGSRVIGPALAGLLIKTVGYGWCFTVDGLSYIAVLVSLWMMRPTELRTPAPTARAKGQVRAGLRYVRTVPDLWIPLVMMALIGTFAFNFQVVIPLMAAKTFDVGAGGIALLLSSMGAGAVLGGLSVASRRGVSYKRLISLSMTMGVMILVAAIMPTLATEAIALFFMGAAAFAFIAVANTTIQLTAAPEMRGRVMALYAIAFLGSTPIGGPIVGWISQQYGARIGFAIGGVAAIGATVVAGRALARYRSLEPAESGVLSARAA